ncbi:MAG TPA: Rne/Rng family ribonuclease [Candidatus Elarobacter sp.]|nr:Rne/Rng family ribonuclease [Candidatus Elarobacter sp.]
MPTDILISSDPWENRVAILEDGRLAEIYVEREERVIGSIYKGKVVNVLPGMGASFVDIGLGRNAFLYVDDINKTPLNIGDVEVTSGRSGYTITEKVSRGDDVLVQIVKEPRGLKGARVSTNISLPGRYLILMPTGKFSGVSRKIESAEERNRLKTIMKAIRPEGMATVVRTAAGGVSSAELIADLGVLIRMWHGILEQYKRVEAPALLHKDMNLVYKTARDFITPEVKDVWLDDETETENVRDFMWLLGPQYVDRIKYYEGGKRLFADFRIDEEIARLMKPTVKLPSGGSIVIESTEALTVVDVNSGKFTGGKNLDDTIVRTNVEAASEIARQVRLRDIGGIIVCDFIDMSSEGDRNRVISALQEGLRKDRTRSTIQSFSPLGLLEFTRKRVGKDLGQQLRGKCPTCEGLGSVMSPESVAIGAFREILGHKNGVANHVHIAASPHVAAQAEYWYEDERVKLAEQVGAEIDVYVDPAVHPERPRIVWGDDKLATLAPIRVGDEFEVELLNLRLPNATSAAAIVAGRLIEVENAANAAGKTIKIKILDVDGSDILAEPRTPVEAAAASGEGRGGKKRRRGGRGRKRDLTPAEQAAELRELAEEAEKGLGGRSSIGISTTEEVAAKKNIPKTTAQKAADGSVALLPGEVISGAGAGGRSDAVGRAAPGRDRDRGVAAGSAGAGGGGRRGGAAASAGPSAVLPGERLSGAAVAGLLPGEKLSGDRVSAGGALLTPPSIALHPTGGAVIAGGGPGPAAEGEHEGEEAGRRRRRRRRRGGRGNEVAAMGAAPHAAPAGASVTGPAPFDAEADEDEDETAAVAQAGEGAGTQDGERKRRRRRRRRRGRGGAGAEGQQVAAAGEGEAQQRPVPDRHIFRVDSEGGAHATGETAPPVPSRAIAPWNRKRGDVAVEPPPAVITPPPEPSEPVKAARPSRRRRTAEAEAAPVRRGGRLEAAAPVRALPAPAAEARTEATRTSAAASAEAHAAATAETAAPARRRTTRRGAAAASEAAADTATAEPATATKRTTRSRKTADDATAAPARAKKSSAGGTATAKKTPARKVTAKKAPAKKTAAAKPAAAAKKSTSTRKTSAAKKSTTTRKKR